MRRKGWWVATLLSSALAIAAGGCTGSQILESGNSTTRFEFVVVGDTIEEFDCAPFELGSIRLFPLDGVCDAASTNAGDPCFQEASCIGGACEGSSAADIIDPLGLLVYDAAAVQLGKANLYGTVCEATNPDVSSIVDSGPWVDPAPFVLSSGLYEISAMKFFFSGLFKDGAEEPEEPPVPDQYDLRICTNEINVVLESGAPLRFTVDAAAPKVVRFEMRADKLEEFFVNTGSTSANCPALRDNFQDIFICTTCDAGVVPAP